MTRNVELAELGRLVVVDTGNNVTVSSNNFTLGNTAITGGLAANGSVGVAGQLLTSNGSATYWANKTSGSVATGFANGLPNTGMVEGDVYVANNTGSAYVFEATANAWLVTGTSKLSGLGDVALANTQDGSLLRYQANTAKWVNEALVPDSDKFSLPASSFGYHNLAIRGNEIWIRGLAGATRLSAWVGRCNTDRYFSSLVPFSNADGTGIPLPTSWKKVVSTMSVIHAIDNNGSLWSLGRDDEGQQGTNNIRGTGVSSLYGLSPNWDPAFWKADGTVKVIDIFAAEKFPVEDAGYGTFYAVVLDNGVYKNYAWGRNDYGITGVGNNNAIDQANLGKPNLITAFPAGKYIKSLSTTFGITAVVLDDGTVWTVGYNANGALGINSTVNSTTFVKSKLIGGADLPTAVDVKVGWSEGSATNTYVLLASGEVLTCGERSFGSLANGSLVTGNQTGFNYALTGAGTRLTNIKKINVHFASLLALANDGKLYHAGRNWNGLRGDGSSTSTSYAYASICQIGVTDFWTIGGTRGFGMMVFNKPDAQGNIILNSAGYQIYGITGHWYCPGDGDIIYSAPIPLPVGEYVVDLRTTGLISNAGTFYQGIQVLTNKNRIYCWGRNYGASMLSGRDDATYTPQLVTDMGGRPYT
jgi:alpha-tubulin suppressor-like RCC1 family protein